MSDPTSPRRPTDAELEILTVLWSLGPATVREVHEVIAKRRNAQYWTVLKQMQIMAEKGLLLRDDRERAHVYTAAQPREWMQQQLAGDLLDRAFYGSATQMLIGALSSRRVSKEEIARIRRLIDGYEPEK